MEPEKKKNVVVETFADDMAEALRNDTEGTVKKIIEGAQAQEDEKKNLSPESKKNKVFMITSIVLLALGTGLLSFFMLTRGPKTVPVESQFTPIIFNDKTSFIEVSGFKKDEIENSVLNKINSTDVKKGGLEGIYPTLSNKIIGLRSFLPLIQSSLTLPSDQALVSDSFLIGVVNVDTEPETINRPGFFMLMKMRTTPDIFPSMRAWESKMFFDLHGFLGLKLNADTTYLLTKDFEDGIVDNKNARLLYDNNKKLLLMYAFVDDNSVVLTNSESALHEVILRVASKKTKQ
jgi:hypothetical protein